MKTSRQHDMEVSMLSDRQKRVIRILLMYMKDYKKSLLESELIDLNVFNDNAFIEKMYELYDRKNENGWNVFTLSFQGWDTYFRYIEDFLASGLTKKEYCDGDRSLMGKLNYELQVADKLTDKDFLDNIKCSISIIQRATKEVLICVHSISKEHVGYRYVILEDGTFEITAYETVRTAREKTDKTNTRFSAHPYPGLVEKMQDLILENHKLIENFPEKIGNRGSSNQDILMVGDKIISGENIFDYIESEGPDSICNMLSVFIMRIEETVYEYLQLDDINAGLMAV